MVVREFGLRFARRSFLIATGIMLVGVGSVVVPVVPMTNHRVGRP